MSIAALAMPRPRIRLPLTLGFYLLRTYVTSFLMLLAAFMAISFLFDLVEMLRRTIGREGVTFNITLTMSLLKQPHLALQIMPFAVLFGSMLTFWRLTRSQELVVMRSAGVSVWQFIMPVVLCAMALGIIKIAVINPVASAMLFRYEEMESKYIKGAVSIFAASENGLWIRQVDSAGESVIHADNVNAATFELRDPIIYIFHGEDQFTGRIDAKVAKLEPGYWKLTDASITGPDKHTEFMPEYRLNTNLTFEEIQDSFASPESISFWELPRFIEALQRSGFSAIRHRLYWNSLLAVPLQFCAMVLVAATFSLRHHRRGGVLPIIAAGVFIGFLVYFLSNVAFALGLTGVVPIFLSAWSPSCATLLFGLAMLFHLEDG